MKNNLRNTAWIDLLLERIRVSRISFWFLYPVILILLAIADQAIFINGPDQGLIESFSSAFSVVWALAINDALHRLAGPTFDQFSSSLDLSKSQIEEYRRRFKFASPWTGWIALLFGAITFSTFWVAGVKEGLLETTRSPAFAFLYGLIIFVGSSTFIMYFVFNSIRRLRLITQFHEMIKDIELSNLEPLRAFSRFSSSTAVALLLSIAISFRGSDDFEDFAFLIVLGLLAVVIFVVPLVGLRNRIASQRDVEIQSINADLALISHKIKNALHEDNLEKLGMLKGGQDSLLVQREELTKIRTWPWKPATIRGFSSAFLLPILIWLITRVLERFV